MKQSTLVVATLVALMGSTAYAAPAPTPLTLDKAVTGTDALTMASLSAVKDALKSHDENLDALIKLDADIRKVTDAFIDKLPEIPLKKELLTYYALYKTGSSASAPVRPSGADQFIPLIKKALEEGKHYISVEGGTSQVSRVSYNGFLENAKELLNKVSTLEKVARGNPMFTSLFEDVLNLPEIASIAKAMELRNSVERADKTIDENLAKLVPEGKLPSGAFKPEVLDLLDSLTPADIASVRTGIKAGLTTAPISTIVNRAQQSNMDNAMGLLLNLNEEATGFWGTIDGDHASRHQSRHERFGLRVGADTAIQEGSNLKVGVFAHMSETTEKLTVAGIAAEFSAKQKTVGTGFYVKHNIDLGQVQSFSKASLGVDIHRLAVTTPAVGGDAAQESTKRYWSVNALAQTGLKFPVMTNLHLGASVFAGISRQSTTEVPGTTLKVGRNLTNLGANTFVEYKFMDTASVKLDLNYTNVNYANGDAPLRHDNRLGANLMGEVGFGSHTLRANLGVSKFTSSKMRGVNGGLTYQYSF